MARTLVTGNILRSGSIPTTALGGGVVTSSAQIISAFPTDVVSSSVQVTSFLPTGTVSSSTQVKEYLPTDTVSSSVQITTFLPVNTVSSSGQVTTFLPVGTVSSSTQVKEYLPTDTVSSSVQVTAFLPAGTVSSSTQLPSGIASSSAQVTDYLPTGTVSGSGQIDVFSTVGGNTLATTGSNTFTGITTFSNTTNSTSYLDGAVHIAGGMSIQKDLRISGSVNINGLLTVVSMSSQYVTSSQYNLGVSKITVNDDDNVRFAGLSVFDSGSSSPATASIFWDSLQHRFIYENLSGSSYNSAILMAGPKNTGSLGNETGLTSGYIPYATGGDHIDNSVMFQSGSNIGIGTTSITSGYKLDVRGSIYSYVASGNTSFVAATGTNANAALNAVENFGLELNTDATNRNLRFSSNNSPLMTILSGGNVGIGTTNPEAKLAVVASTSNIDSSVNVAYRSGSNSSLFSTGLSINATSKSNTSSGSAAFLEFNVRAPALNGSHGTAAHIVLTTGSGTNFGNGQFDFYIRNDTAPYTFNNDAVTDSQYWMSSLMTIKSTGNIGIGSTNPSHKLQVNGTIAIGSDGDKFRLSDEGSYRRIQSYNSEPLAINPLGNNVGIGTTNPGSLLEVYAGSGNNYIYTKNATSNTFNGLMVRIGSTDYMGFIGNPSTGETRLGGFNASGYYTTIYSNNSESMRITGGNVGIGITDPSRKLQIRTDDSSTGGNVVGVRNANSTAGAFINFLGGGANAPSIGAKGNDIVFTADGYNGTELLRVTSAGNVGIGTGNPSQKLHVEGSSAIGTTGTEDILILGRALSGGVSFQQAASFKLGRYQNAGGSYESFTRLDIALRDNAAASNYNTNTTVMTLTNAGYVGIGVTNPSAKLDVRSGNIALSDPSSTTGAGYAIEWLSNNGGTQVSYSGIDAITTSAGARTGDLRFFTSNAGAPTEKVRITSAGHVLPGANGTQNLGSSSLRWATVFTSDLSLSNGIGDWTIVEGEDDLFIYNNKNNKVYKFTLQEVDPSTATPKKS